MKNEARYAAFLVLTSSPPAGRRINTQAGYQPKQHRFTSWATIKTCVDFGFRVNQIGAGKAAKKSVGLKKTSKEKSVMNNEEL